MSMHTSLKFRSGALNRHRNVLTRAERIRILSEKDKFNPEADSPLGLLKVRSIKVAAVKKPAKEEAAEGEEGVEGDAAAEPTT